MGGPCCRRSGKWPRRLHRRRTLGANCPAVLGAVFEVAGFDGWSLRSTAKTTLEMRPGWESTSPDPPEVGTRPHSMMVSRHWKNLRPKIQTLESRDSDQAAKSSGVQPEPSGALSKLCGRPDRTACALSWLAVPRSGIGAVGEWSPSIRSLFLFARAPKTEEEKTGGTNRAAIAASTVPTGDPAASLGPTFRRADRRQRPS